MSADTCWYYNDNNSNPYYTPFQITERKAYYVGDGSFVPNPKQAAEFINSMPKCDILWGNIFTRWEKVTSGDVQQTLPGGTYWYKEESHILPDRLCPFKLRDEVMVKISGAEDQITSEIRTFLENEQVYRDIGSIYKLGLLAYGSAGNSKTRSINKIIKEIIPADAIVIFVPAQVPSSDFLFKIKETLNDRLKVFVFEEFSTGLNDKYQVSETLTFLDGELSPDKTIFLATTNYPEALPGNMVDRPSRFDKLIEFKNPNPVARAALITHFLSRPSTAEEVTLTRGLSVAGLKEACIRVILEKCDLNLVIKELKARTALCDKAFAKPVKTSGFGIGSYEDDE